MVNHQLNCNTFKSTNHKIQLPRNSLNQFKENKRIQLLLYQLVHKMLKWQNLFLLCHTKQLKTMKFLSCHMSKQLN